MNRKTRIIIASGAVSILAASLGIAALHSSTAGMNLANPVEAGYVTGILTSIFLTFAVIAGSEAKLKR